MLKKIVKIQSNFKNKIKKPLLQGHIDLWDGMEMHGWYVNKSDEENVFLYFDNKKITPVEQTVYREDIKKSGLHPKGNSGFKIKVDINEIRAANIKKIRICNRSQDLNGSPYNIITPNLRGHLDSVSENYATGWVFDTAYPSISLKLDIYINGYLVETIVSDQMRHDLIDEGMISGKCGFTINLSQISNPLKANTLSIKLYGTQIEVFPTQVINGQSSKAAALTKVQNIVKKAMFEHNDTDLQWINYEVLPQLIDNVRKGNCSLNNLSIILNDSQRKFKATDIIIPVYKGLDETINCIKSVFSVKSNTVFNVIVINDCSPEPKLTTTLQKLVKELPFTLLENESNLGFVQTVNKGMSASQESDVLLLNSDTVVTDYWLDRILKVAYSDNTIGTVTPFSNNATICSYPKFCADNKLPSQVDLASLAEVVSQNEGIIDLPTAHGFSMFIKRQTLNEVGLFDNQKWGKGYAEENDFSLRCARLGWRNVMATNAFVHHLGSVSFAEDSAGFIAKNLEKLNSIYPDYSQNVKSFIKEDPIRPYRNNIAINLMKKEVEKQKAIVENYEGSFIFVSLTIGGGTEVATNNLSKIHLDNHRCVFMLVSPKPNTWVLKSQIDNSFAEYRLPQELDELKNHLAMLDVSKFHIHHTIEFDKSIWALPKKLGVPYDITLHDYYTICPRVNLVDDSEFYCGEPNEAACNRCVRKNGVHESSLLKLSDFDNDITSWRNFFEHNLKQADKVITPSFDTKDRILKYFKLDNIEAIYHPEAEFNYKPKSLKDIGEVNIAFIGAIGVHKGLNVLKECAEYAYKFDLPVRFIVIGYTSDDNYFDHLPNVTITGKYDKNDLPKLISEHNCHIAGLFSVWPETYSYTLSEALRENLLIASFNMGAIPERNCESLLFDDIKDVKKYLERGVFNV